MGDGGSAGVDTAALERELASLPEVQAARIVVTPSGRITEIHLITDDSKPPKGIVRDVETVAQARFGLEIDRRIVSAVQFPTASVAMPARRIALTSLSLTTEGNILRCRVRIEADEETALGETTGPATSSARGRLVAHATAGALAELSKTATLDVADVRVVAMGHEQVAVVLVVALGPDGEELTMSGSAPIRGDEGEAIARAVIDAVVRPAGA